MDTSQFIGVFDDGLYFTKKGNLMADSPETVEKLFANCKSIIAIHSEKEEIVEANEQVFREKYGEDIPAKIHPIIRSAEGCYEANKHAIELAKKHNARIHILHLTTEAETRLFQNDIPLQEKKITTEVSLEKIVDKMCHNPATLYSMTNRGFIREGYYADLVLIDLDNPWTVAKDNLLYKCGWSPLEGTTFRTAIKQTFVNGNLVYDNGVFNENSFGMPIAFTYN